MSVAPGETGWAIARPVVGVARGVSAHGVSARSAVWAATAVSAIAWATVGALRESRFLDGRYNLGNFTQAVWATAHGHFMQITEVGGHDVSRLGIHVDPIIVLFTPLWWLWPDPRLLVTVQAVAISLGAVPLFWLGRKHLPRESDAALLAVAYLLSPTLAWNAVTAFSAVALAVPALLFAIWYLDEGRFVPFAVAAGAAVLCQEQIGLIVGCLGLWYAWRRKRLAVGLTIAAAGFAASAIDFLVVLRHFSDGSPFAARYGGSPSAIVRDLFTNPLVVLRQINGHDLLGLVLAVPVLGLCFGSTIIFAAMPQVALLLLSRRGNEWDWAGGNVLPLIPFIYAATVFALARSARESRRRWRRLDASLVLALTLVVAAVLPPFGLGGATNLLQSRNLSAQRQAVGLIPANAPVSATTYLAVQVSARRYLYVFPVLKGADWVLVDARDPRMPDMSFIHRRAGMDIGVNDLYWQPRLMRRELRRLERSQTWRLVYRRHGIYVFRRTRT